MKLVMLHHKIAMIFLLLALTTAPFAEEHRVITPAQSEEIINRIRQKAIAGYRIYRGIETTREINTEEYEAKTGKLKSTSKALIIFREYFYEIPDTKVLRYTKNGEKKPVSDYRKSKDMPGYPVFDEEGTKRYAVRIAGYKMIANKRCYQIDIKPKQKTARHFAGALYARVDNLEIIMIEGTVGDLPLGVKELSTKLSTRASGDLTVLKSGIIKLRIYIPLLYPDTRLVTSIKVLEHKLILR
jgi:hypothetical protein